MNRREALQAGLGLAVGAVVPIVTVTPTAIADVAKLPSETLFTRISYVGDDGVVKTFAVPDGSPRYVWMVRGELVGADDLNGPIRVIDQPAQ